VSQFGIDRARELAAESRRTALDALAEAAGRSRATAELEGITDFIYTRTS
jgi:geranylgeranyl pyrophosphate synthase